MLLAFEASARAHIGWPTLELQLLLLVCGVAAHLLVLATQDWVLIVKSLPALSCAGYH